MIRKVVRIKVRDVAGGCYVVVDAVDDGGERRKFRSQVVPQEQVGSEIEKMLGQAGSYETIAAAQAG